MKPHQHIVAVTVIYLSALCVAQDSPKEFHWNWQKAEGLTWKDSISKSKNLSPEEREGLISALSAQIRPSMNELAIKSEEELRQFVVQIRVRAIDLTGNGSTEFIAQGMDDRSCSPTGNCDLWVFRRKGSSYVSILYSAVAQTYTIQPTVTHGFYDLVVGMHGSATEQDLKVYRFDGYKYRYAACYDANWTVFGKNDEILTLKEP